MSDATFIRRASAQKLAITIVGGLTIPAAVGDAGNYQSPVKSRLLAEIQTSLGGSGLLRASHLRAFMDAANSVRTIIYSPGQAGEYEDPSLHIGKRAAELLPNPEALVSPDTAREVLDLLTTASFS